MVGLGFNIKMLESFLVLPAFYLLYLLAAPVSWWRRFLHLGLATVVVLVVSLSWAMVVDLAPADQRPYVGSSSNNSELDLIVGYNGLGRLMGRGYGTELITQLIPGYGGAKQDRPAITSLHNSPLGLNKDSGRQVVQEEEETGTVSRDL